VTSRSLVLRGEEMRISTSRRTTKEDGDSRPKEAHLQGEGAVSTGDEMQKQKERVL